MAKLLLLTCALGCVVALAGCGVSPLGRSSQMDVLMRQNAEQQRKAMERMENMDVDTMMEKQQLMQDMMSNPDLPAWHDQREKMALALGDRQFDKGFDRVFDSMEIALASLGCRVQNMERASGYITASIPELPPEQLQTLQKDGTRQYAVTKGYKADIVDRKSGFDVDPNAMMGRYTSGLTLSMVKQGPEMTKVKLRFDNVYYPTLVEEYYTVVWHAVDKQMFLDKALD
jgi:hypothetical protein